MSSALILYHIGSDMLYGNMIKWYLIKYSNFINHFLLFYFNILSPSRPGKFTVFTYKTVDQSLIWENSKRIHVIHNLVQADREPKTWQWFEIWIVWSDQIICFMKYLITQSNIHIYFEKLFFDLFHIVMPYNKILSFCLPYFHVSNSVLFST